MSLVEIKIIGTPQIHMDRVHLSFYIAYPAAISKKSFLNTRHRSLRCFFIWVEIKNVRHTGPYVGFKTPGLEMSTSTDGDPLPSTYYTQAHTHSSMKERYSSQRHLSRNNKFVIMCHSVLVANASSLITRRCKKDGWITRVVVYLTASTRWRHSAARHSGIMH